MDTPKHTCIRISKAQSNIENYRVPKQLSKDGIEHGNLIDQRIRIRGDLLLFFWFLFCIFYGKLL